jgi:hypothetical protein
MIALMGFPKLGAAIYTATALEDTYRHLYDVRHVRYVVPLWSALDSADFNS